MKTTIFPSILLTTLFAISAAGQGSPDVNFLIRYSVLVPNITSESSVFGLNTGDVKKTLNFFDGLGRPIQTIEIQNSPGLKDLIRPREYDEFGREKREYLPYTMETAGAYYHQNYQTELSSFYLITPKVAHTSFFYSDKVFESSPLNRVLKQSFPGYSWSVDPPVNPAPHLLEYHYQSNYPMEVVKQWQASENSNWNTIRCSSTSFYGQDELFLNITQDENNHLTGEYVDKSGKVILKIQDISSSIQSRTYFVYDLFGRLRVVIPPEAETHFDRSTANASISKDFADKWCFSYRYDKRGRLIEKTIPGADKITYAYNTRDQIVFEQDGNMRQNGQNIYYKYDKLGRMIQKGIYTNGSLITQVAAQDYIDQGIFSDAEKYVGNQVTDVFGYTNLAAPILTGSDIVLLVNYYDSYDFVVSGTGLDFVSDALLNVTSYNGNIVGELSGSTVKIIGQTDYLTSVNYYDDRYRLIQSRSQNNKGGLDIITNQYDFEGKLLKSRHVHNISGGSVIDLLYSYTYDHGGRLKYSYLNINDSRDLILTCQNYNEIGQLIEKNYYGTIDNSKIIQSVDYSYNTRGWLTHINSSSLTNSSIAYAIDNQMYPDYVVGMELDSIVMSVTELLDSLNNPYLNITLNDMKQLVIENNSSTREEGSEEGGEVIVKDADTLYDLTLLNPIKNNTYYFDFNEFEVTENTGTEEYLDYTTDVIKQTMIDYGFTDSTLLDQVALIINSFAVARVGFVYFNDDDNDLYGQDIMYDAGFEYLGGARQYNGNISGIKWQMKGITGQYAYGFQYNHANWLLESNYAKSTPTGWNGDLDRYSMQDLTYDDNGNLLTLKRYGCTGMNGGTPQFGLIDDLSYDYTLNSIEQGNKLIAVNDVVNDFTYTGANDFSDNTSTGGNEYGYDVNGNMIRDDNKLITSVLYNYLNLPKEINFSNGSKILYIYDAIGNKLKKVFHPSSGPDIVHEYIGNFIYEDNLLSYVLIPDGRITFDELGKPQIEYFLKDHLGDVMVVYTEDPANNGKPLALHQYQYYPFGMEYRGLASVSSGQPNNYKYNGKELQDEGRLDWYDYGARFYDPQLGRWHMIDPKAEVYFKLSPYNYVDNNPCMLIDPDGKFPIIPPGTWAVAGAWIAEKIGAMNRLLTGTSGNINAPQGMVPEGTQSMSKLICTTQDATTLAEAPIEIAQGTAEFTSDAAPVVGGTLMLFGYAGAPFSGGATLPLVTIGGEIMAVGGAVDMLSDFNKGNYGSVAIDLSINAIFGGLGKGIKQLKNADKLDNANEAILNFFKDLSKVTSDEIKNQVEKKVNRENTNDDVENNR